MTAAKSVTATYTTPTYALTVSKSGNGAGTVTSNPSGINCGSTCSYSFNSGTSVVLSAAASSGSTFTGWSGGVCGGLGFITDKTCVVQVSSAKNVTAIFDPNYSYIYVTNYGTRYGTVVSPALSINCGFSCSARVLIGSQITLIAQANRLQGTSFKGWIGDCAAYGASSICYLDVAGKDLSVGAIFK
jgi:hypothetical protein